MAHVRKKLPACPGDGELRYRGFRGPVHYEILGEPSSLRAGTARLRGSIRRQTATWQLLSTRWASRACCRATNASRTSVPPGSSYARAPCS